MFKLVGNEIFSIGKDKRHSCVIKIDPLGGFSYQYSLEIDGKPYKTFLDNQTKVGISKMSLYASFTIYY